MNLQGAALVQLALRFKVSILCFLCGFERAEIDGSSANTDLSGKFSGAFLRTNAKPSRNIVAAGNTHILRIDFRRRMSQVRPSVVILDAIDAINKFLRKLSIHIKKRESMFCIQNVIDANGSVAVGERSIAGALARFCLPFVLYPSEKAEVLIVVKDFAQARGGKIGNSHDALQLLIGQGPAGVDSTARASSFYRVLA